MIKSSKFQIQWVTTEGAFDYIYFLDVVYYHNYYSTTVASPAWQHM